MAVKTLSDGEDLVAEKELFAMTHVAEEIPLASELMNRTRQESAFITVSPAGLNSLAAGGRLSANVES
jgi:hypothetical protein